MSSTPYLWVLLATTFCLSALWAAILMVLVRVPRPGPRGGPSHMGVELAWAVIPVLLVLAVVLPTLQSRSAPAFLPGQTAAQPALSEADSPADPGSVPASKGLLEARAP